MADAETMIAKLRRRLSITGTGSDTLLGDLITDSCAICAQKTVTDLDSILEPAIIWHAAASYNLLGIEGASSHSEGGVSVSVDKMPVELRRLLDMYRVARVGNE